MSKKFAPRLKLKSIRVEHGESQADVARVLGVSEPTYNQKELGKRDFSLDEAIKLAKYYGKTLDEIFFTQLVNTNETKKMAI